MKKLLTLFLMFGALLFLFASSIQAAPIITTFTDTTYFWGGNPGVSGMSLGAWESQDQDVVGSAPYIGGGSVTTDGGLLTHVSISYESGIALDAGDLFINLLNGPNDSNWDYVLSEGDVYSFANVAFSALKGVNNGAYKTSTLPDRIMHPFAISDWVKGLVLPLKSGAYSSGDFVVTSGDSITFELNTGFSSLLDTQGKDFIIAFGPTCANDVIYEKVSPVPIPTSILLFGSGLVGLAGIRRKRR